MAFLGILIMTSSKTFEGDFLPFIICTLHFHWSYVSEHSDVGDNTGV